KKQYRKLATEYHPDKIQAKGLPEEFVKFANDNFIKIQEAYEYIKKKRGL
ncbi:MAG: DnaJ domain-containing protein, partial [Desulfobacteraceae bacterium]|nr:DnaJ domain-containing protein [Desulfobacteraceae bacterium]